VTTATVAALLTILGYSLYDTIIVFDRIRENVPRMPRATFSQIVNRSMSEVVTRSLATSFAVLMPIGSLLLFGGETLKDFAFALLVGVASGAYSSIFIASPVLTLWKEREPVYVRRRRIVMEDHRGLVPAFAAVSLGEGAAAAPEGAPAADRRQMAARRARAGGPRRQRKPPPPPPKPAAVEGEPGGDGAGAEAEPVGGDGAPAEVEPAVGEGAPAPPATGDGGTAGSRVSSTAGASGAKAQRPKKTKPKRQRSRKKHGRR
jgi:SecD/SecF fusion protein